MFLTLTTTGTSGVPATDLGYLLYKHPDKAQQYSTSHGTAHVFYPEAQEDRCTVALLLDVDPVGLARSARRGRQGPEQALAQYVNDRTYAASSLLAVALGQVFRSAMQGRCDARPELAAAALPLEVRVPAVRARGGADAVREFFEPCGWTVDAEPVGLDPQFPEWGESPYVSATLTGNVRLADALRQLYVLLPVLDDSKHYWMSPDEVDKLLRVGEGWLAAHPRRETIARRYLQRRPALTRAALERLAEIDEVVPEELDNAVPEEETGEEEPVVKRPSLAQQRRDAVIDALHRSGAARVLDLGCGEGSLVGALLDDSRFTEVVGVDVSTRALEIAARRLHLDRMPERRKARVKLLRSALTYTDPRLKGYDAAVLSEVIEHVDEPRLPALEFAVFGAARPATVVVTTPNAEYNVRWESLPAGGMRHADHRFEWDREQFAEWARTVAERYGYAVEFGGVGDEDPDVGRPTQTAVFRTESAA